MSLTGELLMVWIWISMVTASSAGRILVEETSNLQPCPFNLLCRCSRGGPEVGLIYCEDIPLAQVPLAINNTKAFALNLRRNELHRLEENVFHGTGLWRIDIRGNYLTSVPEMAFSGLERSLGELYLPSNRLHRVPQKALRNLEKLKVLDLGDNQIVDINREDFAGLENSLQSLSIADNYIVTIQLEVFQGFQRLERLDLKGNSILNIVPLNTGNVKIAQLNLADNALERIPFTILSQIRSLSSVNLGGNRIGSTFDVFFQGRISMDSLILDNNLIGPLPPFAFQNFNTINRTSLNGNNIKQIAEDAFKDAKIRELSLSDCSLAEIETKAFRGLEVSLQRLDLSFNNLSTLPEHLLDKFDYLKTLLLNENTLSFNPEEVLSGFRYTLQTINLIGLKMGPIPVKEMNNIRNLRSMGLSSLRDKVTAEDLEGFGAALEHLSLAKNNLKSIAANAFRHVPGLKNLDLSENRITQIDPDAFLDVAASLTSLHAANGLAFSSLPSEPFRKLHSLRSIDLSNNRITSVSNDFFHSMKDLCTINMQDNSIEKIPLGLFENEHNPSLSSISLAFNFVVTIESQSFVDLSQLKTLNLDDNKITKILKGAFQNNENLESVYLEGNMIDTIEPEAFHNLPKLELLNLAYNKLGTLSFDWLDQVGTLSAIKLDMSHNNIQQLSSNRTGWASYASIRHLDLGYNNISFVSRNYFEPIRSSLTHLVLRHNQLRNISRDIYSMEHLLWLDMSSNQIQLVDSDAFANAKSLQVLFLDNNEISEIYQDMLSRSSTLRVINLSHNRLRFLPDTLFKDTQLEILDVSYNQISKIPDGCLSRIANTLRHLDVSHNEINFVNAEQFKKLTSLTYLDLSNNQISTLTEKTFSSLSQLTYLDLSYNPIQTMAEYIFDDLMQSLVHLNLASVGRVNLSDFHLPDLLFLNISHNTVENLPSDFFTRYANLKEFDVSHCQMTVLHESPWSTASKLRALHLNGNQLTTITNGTLAAMKSLEYLNIQDLPLQVFEEGSLYQMTALRHLAISTYEKIKGLDIPRLLDYNNVLKHLEIEVESGTLDNQLRGKLPFKINNITISGEKLKTISNTAFKDFQAKSLTMRLRDNGVTELNRAIFQNLGQVRWLQLDLRHNQLSSVAEPSTTLYPGTGNSVFLTNIHMSENPWSCDCTVGWVEFWMRKYRQFMCKERCQSHQQIIRDLRTSSCKNRGNSSLITILKTELECGWSSSTTLIPSSFHWTLIIAVGVVLINKVMRI